MVNNIFQQYLENITNITFKYIGINITFKYIILLNFGRASTLENFSQQKKYLIRLCVQYLSRIKDWISFRSLEDSHTTVHSPKIKLNFLKLFPAPTDYK